MTQRACETIREKLSALIDADLTPGDRRDVEDHLRACVACEAEARAMRETLGALRSLPRPEAPPDLVARIDRAIDGQGSRRAGGRTRIRRHAVAMIFVVVLLAGIIRVIPQGPRSLVSPEPILPAAPPAPMGQSAPREAEEVAPAADRNRAASRLNAAPPAKSPPQEAPVYAEGRGDLAKEEQRDAVTAEPGSIGAVTSGADAAAPPGPTALALLRAPRSEPVWADALRGVITDRPGDLVPAWKSLTAAERREVLAHWKRSATAPGIAGDLDAAMKKATDPDLRFILQMLREFTP